MNPIRHSKIMKIRIERLDGKTAGRRLTTGSKIRLTIRVRPTFASAGMFFAPRSRHHEEVKATRITIRRKI